MLWHQKNADTRGPDISIPLIYLVSAFFWQHFSGWEEVRVGHKSVRQLYFLHTAPRCFENAYHQSAFGSVRREHSDY
jgi:hypothetical protein